MSLSVICSCRVPNRIRMTKKEPSSLSWWPLIMKNNRELLETTARRRMETAKTNEEGKAQIRPGLHLQRASTSRVRLAERRSITIKLGSNSAILRWTSSGWRLRTSRCWWLISLLLILLLPPLLWLLRLLLWLMSVPAQPPFRLASFRQAHTQASLWASSLSKINIIC